MRLRWLLLGALVARLLVGAALVGAVVHAYWASDPFVAGRAWEPAPRQPRWRTGRRCRPGPAPAR